MIYLLRTLLPMNIVRDWSYVFLYTYNSVILDNLLLLQLLEINLV